MRRKLENCFPRATVGLSVSVSYIGHNWRVFIALCSGLSINHSSIHCFSFFSEQSGGLKEHSSLWNPPCKKITMLLKTLKCWLKKKEITQSFYINCGEGKKTAIFTKKHYKVQSDFSALMPIFGGKNFLAQRNNILVCCLTDNSLLNDLLLGVNYANDVQTNSSWGQLRQPLISGQFSSCFTDVQLKIAFEQAHCLLWCSWQSPEQRWAGTTHSFDKAEPEIASFFLSVKDVASGIFPLNCPYEDNNAGKNKHIKMPVSIKTVAPVNCLMLHCILFNFSGASSMWNLSKPFQQTGQLGIKSSE